MNCLNHCVSKPKSKKKKNKWRADGYYFQCSIIRIIKIKHAIQFNGLIFMNGFCFVLVFTWWVHLRTVLVDYPTAPMQSTNASAGHQTNCRILYTLNESIARCSKHCLSTIVEMGETERGKEEQTKRFSEWNGIYINTTR